MADETKQDILMRLLPDLQAEGYDVYVKPSAALVPQFFEDYRPDAIALRSDKKIALEVVRRSSSDEKKLTRIAALFLGRSDWDLRVVYLDPADGGPSVPVQSRPSVEDGIDETRSLLEAQHTKAALLLGWATFEAAARAMMEGRFERPQTPGRLVETLASEGAVTPTEADSLRGLAAKRNRLVHGELEVDISKDEMLEFMRIIEILVHERVH